jgi:hypothetical protein
MYTFINNNKTKTKNHTLWAFHQTPCAHRPPAQKIASFPALRAAEAWPDLLLHSSSRA